MKLRLRIVVKYFQVIRLLLAIVALAVAVLSIGSFLEGLDLLGVLFALVSTIMVGMVLLSLKVEDNGN